MFVQIGYALCRVVKKWTIFAEKAEINISDLDEPLR